MSRLHKRHYGYKNHINMDMKIKLITTFATSSANVYNLQKLEEFVGEDDNPVYADSAHV